MEDIALPSTTNSLRPHGEKATPRSQLAPASDPFALDVRFIADLVPGDPLAPCDTEDNCPPTCASACASE